jgi:putative SOS response-associated peptidase YedK
MTRPTFTNAFLKRRCIVPAEAFYEWVGPKGARQPLSIQRADGKLLSMAGLFNYWRSKDTEAPPIATFILVTTMPNQWMARIHNRMPVILQDDQINRWLDQTSEPKQLSEMLTAPPEGFLDCYPVSRSINSAKLDEPDFAERIDLDYARLLSNDSEAASAT